MSFQNLMFGRDVAGFNAFAPQPSLVRWSATITNGSETHITVPADVEDWCAAFSFQPGTNVWVDFSGATAIIPVGATLAATTSELNPAARTVKSGTKISIITDNTSADVGITLYAIPGP